MYHDNEACFYYITVQNENYVQLAMPEGSHDGILKGMYRLRTSQMAKSKAKAQLLGSGSIINEVLKAQELLERDYGVAADVYSVTSYKQLRRDGKEVERHNLLHPDKPKVPYVTDLLQGDADVTVVSSDYMKILPDAIARWIPHPLVSLGTDGFGRSDTRANLRDFFEVDYRWVVVSTLSSLVRQKKIDAKVYKKAVKDLNIDLSKADPAIS
jgi:pyruvate dehydrogenase E1 component